MSEIALSDEVLSNVFEYAGIGMAITSLDKRFLRVNDGLCELLGWPVEALIGQSAVDVTHPDMMPARDPLRSLIFHAADRAVRDVYVAGRRIVADGKVTTLDHAGAAARLAEARLSRPQRRRDRPADAAYQ